MDPKLNAWLKQSCVTQESFAQKIGVKQPTINGWKRIPATRVLQVSEITGLSPSQLRPDVFGQ